MSHIHGLEKKCFNMIQKREISMSKTIFFVFYLFSCDTHYWNPVVQRLRCNDATRCSRQSRGRNSETRGDSAETEGVGVLEIL